MSASAWGAWGALWYSRNKLDGVAEHLLGVGGVPILFRSRLGARGWIEDHYGYVRTRADLRREPHGWRLPRAVRVEVRVR